MEQQIGAHSPPKPPMAEASMAMPTQRPVQLVGHDGDVLLLAEDVTERETDEFDLFLRGTYCRTSSGAYFME